MERPVTLREDCLDKAREIITKDRNTTYGTPEDSFTRIAKYWSAHLGIGVTPSDVAIMMGLLKVARLKNNRKHEDSWVDACGYFACGYETTVDENE